jgi:uncharacterized metal-binding protein
LPSGKVHDKITVVTAALAVPVWWFATPVKDYVSLIVALGSYLFSGFWLSDDLDTNSVSYKRWGAFRWLWWPYQKLVPHRSWVSHGLAVGPLIRVLYFVSMLWLLVRGVGWALIQEGIPINRDALLMDAWQHTWSWTLAHPSWAMWGVIGLVLGGVAHSVVDTIVTWAKRVW